MFGRAKKTYCFYYEKKQQVQKPNDEDLSVVVIISWNAQQVETLSSKQQQLKKKPSEKFSAKLNQRPTIAEWRCEKNKKKKEAQTWR